MSRLRFSEEDVLKWKKLYLQRFWSYRKIAKKYDCKHGTVMRRLSMIGVHSRPIMKSYSYYLKEQKIAIRDTVGNVLDVKVAPMKRSKWSWG